MDKTERHVQLDQLVKRQTLRSGGRYLSQASSKPLEGHVQMSGGRSRPNTSVSSSPGPMPLGQTTALEPVSSQTISPVIGGWGDTGGEHGPFSVPTI